MRRAGFALGLLLVLSGCKDPAFTTNEDARFLRGMEEPPPKTPVDLHEWMPTQPEARWTTAFLSASRTRIESNRFVGLRRLGSRTCAVFETTNDRGVAYRTEWYEFREDGVYLAQAGGSDRIVLDPPFLILPNPLIREHQYRWEGKMTFRGVAMPARGLTRYRGPERSNLPIGSAETLRVETVLMAMVDGKTVSFPTTRWFAKGRGVVRSWFRVDQTDFLRDMKTWSTASTREKTPGNTSAGQ